jgi:hypothetical protein
MTDPRSGSDAILDFVRGARDWQALAALGVNIVMGPNGAEIDTPATVATVEASQGDLVAGLLFHLDQGTAQRWSVIVLGCTAIGLESLQDDHDGEKLLELLWDTAFGHPPRRSRVERVAGRIGRDFVK